MKVVNVTTDNREHDRAYDEKIPRFAVGHEALLDGFARTPEIEVHVVTCTQRPMQSPEKLAGNIWFHSLHVPKIGWLRTFYQGCIRAVRRKIREIDPDLVHGHGTERECSISAAFSGFPNLVTIHGNMGAQARLNKPRFGSYLWLAARLEKLTLRKTLGVFCNSSYTEGLVRPLARKTWVVPHALRSAFFSALPDANSRPCVILSAGVISPRKRQLELLDVAENLFRQGFKFEFRFIGFLPRNRDGYAEKFLERIKPMEVEGYARFLGPQPDERLVGCYDSVAGVVHFPTEEAFGNVAIESLARDLKFFGSKVGGIIDIARDIPRAELFEVNDWKGLTEAIGRWIREGHPCSRGSSAIIRKRYHPEEIARLHLEIYREVVASLK